MMTCLVRDWHKVVELLKRMLTNLNRTKLSIPYYKTLRSKKGVITVKNRKITNKPKRNKKLRLSLTTTM